MCQAVISFWCAFVVLGFSYSKAASSSLLLFGVVGVAAIVIAGTCACQRRHGKGSMGSFDMDDVEIDDDVTKTPTTMSVVKHMHNQTNVHTCKTKLDKTQMFETDTSNDAH